jgi:hypothetical protein
MIAGFLHNRRARFLFALFTSAAVTLVYHYYVWREGASYRELIVVCAALIGSVIVFGGERGIRSGFILWVLTLALGYRTIMWTPDLSIHPAEVILWLLVACICVQRRLAASARLTLPIWIWLLLPFWVLAWWPLIRGGVPWDSMLNEFRNFLLLIPLLIVAPVVLLRQNYWRYLLLAFFLTGSCIALMGILEYWFPEVTGYFPAFVRDASPTITQEGFVRANFSFWGGPPATFICVLALPVAIVLATWWPRWPSRTAILGGVVLQILAIYIGGYRSIWLILIIQILITCVLRLKRQGAMVALLCLLFAVGGYELVPRTSERAWSGIAVLRGHPIDSSGRDRKNRAEGALNALIESPYGSGWSAAGWTHSDFLQVAVNLGVAGGLIFLGGYIFTLMRLGRRVLPLLRTKGEHGDLGLSLTLSFIAAGGLLAMEGVSVLPQLVLPVWFVWVLTEVWLRRSAEAPEWIEAVATPHSYQWANARLSASLKTNA